MINYQIAVRIFGGFLEEDSSCDLNHFVTNGAAKQLNFFDKNGQKMEVNELVNQIKQVRKMGRSPVFYARNEKVSIKVCVFNVEDETFIVIPREPYCTKKNSWFFQKKLDLAPYIEIALSFCENFAIYNLSTKAIESD